MVNKLPEAEETPAKVRQLEQTIAKEPTSFNLTSNRITPTDLGFSNLTPNHQSSSTPTLFYQTSQLPESNQNPVSVDTSTISLTQQKTSNLTVDNHQFISVDPNGQSTANQNPDELPNTNPTQLASRPVVEGCTREDIKFLCVPNSSVHCWFFPVATALNKIDNRQIRGNFSCTIVSFVLGKSLLSLSVQCRGDGVLSELWYGLVINCIRLGNTIYDSSSQGARNFSPNEAALTLRDVSPVELEAALPVRLIDSSSACRLGFQINEKMKGQDATAQITCSQRTALLYTNKDDNILMLIDCHQHCDTMGPVIVKGVCIRLPEFLNSIQQVLNINNMSYVQIITFT